MKPAVQLILKKPQDNLIEPEVSFMRICADDYRVIHKLPDKKTVCNN